MRLFPLILLPIASKSTAVVVISAVCVVAVLLASASCSHEGSQCFGNSGDIRLDRPAYVIHSSIGWQAIGSEHRGSALQGGSSTLFPPPSWSSWYMSLFQIVWSPFYDHRLQVVGMILEPSVPDSVSQSSQNVNIG